MRRRFPLGLVSSQALHQVNKPPTPKLLCSEALETPGHGAFGGHLHPLEAYKIEAGVMVAPVGQQLQQQLGGLNGAVLVRPAREGIGPRWMVGELMGPLDKAGRRILRSRPGHVAVDDGGKSRPGCPRPIGKSSLSTTAKSQHLTLAG